MSRTPPFRAVWMWCFAGTAAAVLSTAIPVLGILFAMLGAPFLPVIFINAAFVAMALDARASQFWLLLVPPLLWFGGYALVAAVSYAQVTSLRNAAVTENARNMVRWNRTTQSVRIDKIGTSSEGLASDITPLVLVERYGLDEAYATYRPEAAYGNSVADARTQRVTLDRNSCPERGITASGSLQFHPVRKGGYPSKSPMQMAQGVCIIFQNDALPSAAHLVVALAPARLLSGLIDGIEQDITITAPNQPAFTLRAVQAAPLPWWPMPIIGCHYKGGFGDQSDNGCHAEFRFTSWRGQDEATPLAIAAHALGLKAMTIEQRLPGITWM